MKPRICLLTDTFFPVVGGGETQARALAESLVSEGCAVTVLTRRTSASLRRTERLGGVTVHRLPPAGPEHLKKWGLILSVAPTLVRLRREYDLILVSGFRITGLPAVLVGKLLGKRCVLKEDSLGEMSGAYFRSGLAKLGLTPGFPPFRAFLAVRNRVLLRADAFVAISSEVAEEFLECGVASEQIHRIPNSVDTARFRPPSPLEKSELRRKLGLAPEDTVVAYTGRLVSYKGLPSLLRAWKETSRQRDGVKLLIVGSGGLDIHNCEAELRRYVANNGLDAAVQFTGDVHNVHEYLRASDIFAFPTQREAFGISLIEAMACGLACVSTPVGGVADILTHRVNGLVVEAGDFFALRSALEELMADEALGERLGAAARESVERSYTIESVTHSYLSLFESLLDSGARSDS